MSTVYEKKWKKCQVPWGEGIFLTHTVDTMQKIGSLGVGRDCQLSLRKYSNLRFVSIIELTVGYNINYKLTGIYRRKDIVTVAYSVYGSRRYVR